jgi:CRP/FNR family transcriptional regulator, cyclic AMP receptor protein
LTHVGINPQYGKNRPCSGYLRRHVTKGSAVGQAIGIVGLLADADIEWLAAVGKSKSIAAGERVIVEREPVTALYIILDGEFAVQIAGSHVARVTKGDVLGEISFVDSRPASATVTAVRNGKLIMISSGIIRDRLADDASFAARFYRALAICLVQRMRQQAADRSTSGRSELSEDVDSPDELSPELLDELVLAGKRLEWLMSRFRG